MTSSDDQAHPSDRPGIEPGQGRGRHRSLLHELPVLIPVALILALLIKTFLIQAFFIPSVSMVPTLEVGDRVLVNKVVYHLHRPRRGDVVVFAEPHPLAEPERSWWGSFTHWLTDGLGVTQDPTKDYIKRVIGLPGETVEVRDGTVFVNGRALREPYLSPERELRPFAPQRVPAGALFVMGDNRPHSEDSRFSLGFVPIDRVVGRAFIVVWPPVHLDLLTRPDL